MNQTQNSVERILGALRDVPTPAGMEQRILSTLENTLEAARFETRVKAQRGSSLAAIRMSSLRWAAAVVLVLAGAAAWHGLTPARRSSIATVKQGDVPPAATGDTAIAQRTATITQRDHAQLNAAPRLAIRRNAAPKSTLPRPQMMPEPATAAEENAQLSHPAPPIPPTRQERLLLEYARHGRTEDLAQVSNERRSAQEARDAAEFQEFFKPPVIIGESE